MSQYNEIQVVLNCHGKDGEMCNEALEWRIGDLRAVARYLSSLRIIDIPTEAVLPMKNLYDKIVALNEQIKS